MRHTPAPAPASAAAATPPAAAPAPAATAASPAATSAAAPAAAATGSPLRRPPDAWHPQAHSLWEQGQRQLALDVLLADLNRHGARKPTPRVLQLVYYLFQAGDWKAAAFFLGEQHKTDPANNEVLMNLAACLSRSGQSEQAVLHAREMVARQPDEPMPWDVLCNNLSALGRWAEAAEAGTRSLVLKDQHSLAAHPPHRGQAGAGNTSGTNVIAFSLWGDGQRYLWGALDNLLAARIHYPGWQVRIHLDDSVPAPWQALLAEAGAHLQHEPAGQLMRQKLCWRFKVANDPGVHRFIVRDCDSVLGARERAAVDAWLASGQRFHVMRDWWTHSDLMLAGMWGGTAGVLPALDALLARYTPRAMETPNIDQWFLRDMVWPLVRNDLLMHDRCFSMPGSQPWPTPTPEGKAHVGQNLNAVDAQGQAERLAPWLARLPARP